MRVGIAAEKVLGVSARQAAMIPPLPSARHDLSLSHAAATNSKAQSSGRWTVRLGLMRNPRFDVLFLGGTAAVGMICAAIVVLYPPSFVLLLAVNTWVLGYHHAISTFTRLCFGRSNRRRRALLLCALPVLMAACLLARAGGAEMSLFATAYLYLQWFHYMRQSWGVFRHYQRAEGSATSDTAAYALLTQASFYAVPILGILERSYQNTGLFLTMKIFLLPVSEMMIISTRIGVAILLGGYLFVEIRNTIKQRELKISQLYFAIHCGIFFLSYVFVENIDFGWLCLTIWHNVQYIMFVWHMNNRDAGRVSADARTWFEVISGARNWPFYMGLCLIISTSFYYSLRELMAILPIVAVVGFSINFHHYIADSIMWRRPSAGTSNP